MALTFLKLQDQLALMVGAESVSALPDSEVAQIKARINASYAECYAPVDGRAAPWAKQAVGLRFLAMANLPVVMEADGVTLTCADYFNLDPNMIYAGSPVRLGKELATRVSGNSGDGTITLLEPNIVPSGSYSASFYFSTVALPASAVALDGDPELTNWGTLSPMSGKRSESRHRGFSWSGDFNLPASRALTGTMETGRPLFYFVETEALESGELGLRMSLYPAPIDAYNVRASAFVMPTPLGADTDVPALPASATEAVLLPIALYSYCSNSRRYNGDNRTFLRDNAAEARAKLRNYTRVQKQRGVKLHVRAGYA